jgi:hypothetical protein
MSHLPLNVLSEEDAVRYLLDRVAKENHNAGGEASAQSLAHELGCLPLALEQAASFIIETRWSFAKYQEQFRDARPDLLDERREGGTRYPASVAKTWSITLDQLSPLARSLASAYRRLVCARCHPAQYLFSGPQRSRGSVE